MLRDYVYIIIIGNQGSWRACVRARARARALARLCASVREFVRARARVRAHVSARAESSGGCRGARGWAPCFRVMCVFPSRANFRVIFVFSGSCAFPSRARFRVSARVLYTILKLLYCIYTYKPVLVQAALGEGAGEDREQPEFIYIIL